MSSRDSTHRRTRVSPSLIIPTLKDLQKQYGYDSEVHGSNFGEDNISPGRGLYSTLFADSFMIALRHTGKRPHIAKIYTAATITMFITATIHIVVGLYRLLRGYQDLEASTIYFQQRTWDNSLFFFLHAFMTSIGQLLLTYQCWIIWNQRFLIITPSVLAFLASFGLGLFTNIVWVIPGGVANFPPSGANVKALQPLYFVQNVWTTGLIVYQLAKRHKPPSTILLHGQCAQLNFYEVCCIMLDSASIYTINLLLTNILNLWQCNVMHIFISMSVPTIGIAFNLIFLRWQGAAAAANRAQPPSFVAGIVWSRSGVERSRRTSTV